MKRNRFAQIALLGIVVLFSASFVNAQGTQLLYNKSFENKDAYASWPPECLPIGSGHGGYDLTVAIHDYFDRLTNWVSYYDVDPEDCNPSFSKIYVHSPDWIGGDFSACPKGWDQNFSVGMHSYEVMWQDFVGLEDKYLDINKCYEVRIKVKISNPPFTNPPPFDPDNNKTLDVLLGTQAFEYQEPFVAPRVGDKCEYCLPGYREYFVGLFEDYKTLDRFTIDYINSLGPDPYDGYSISKWFEFHGVIKMSNFDFNSKPIIIGSSADALSHFVQFGLDFRDRDLETGNCAGQYVQIDWVEFFESCPNHYEIHGAMIAGPQDEYVASNSIWAGNLGKGPAIITSNGKTAFKAGNFIELLPGFLADYGSVLDVVPDFICPKCLPHKSMSIEEPFPEVNTREVDIMRTRTANDDELNQTLQVFPNPTSGICMVSSSRSNILSIQLLDNMSQTINIIENINKNKYQLDISNVEAGIYYIMIQTSENETFYRKLVKI